MANLIKSIAISTVSLFAGITMLFCAEGRQNHLERSVLVGAGTEQCKVSYRLYPRSPNSYVFLAKRRLWLDNLMATFSQRLEKEESEEKRKSLQMEKEALKSIYLDGVRIEDWKLFSLTPLEQDDRTLLLLLGDKEDAEICVRVEGPLSRQVVNDIVSDVTRHLQTLKVSMLPIFDSEGQLQSKELINFSSIEFPGQK